LHNRQQKPNFGGMSQTNTFPYQFIVVEGNIGAGKTTFTQQLDGVRMQDNSALQSFLYFVGARQKA
jgi:tRNA A37 threonylcarbamoyladenosine biosynthesis protein TsaE